MVLEIAEFFEFLFELLRGFRFLVSKNYRTKKRAEWRSIPKRQATTDKLGMFIPVFCIAIALFVFLVTYS